MKVLRRTLKALRPRVIFGARTRQALKLDALRLRARLNSSLVSRGATSKRLHLGCGERRIKGWLNVDLTGSDQNIDLACGWLPWPNETFDVVVSQQVIEHLVLEHELLPLLRELYRVCRPGAEIWLTCPDLEKICRAYCEDRGRSLYQGRKNRFPEFDLGGIPVQHMINCFFHQSGEHRNLFDLDMMRWMLEGAGFVEVRGMDESALLRRFQEFPARRDDDHALYVRARRGPRQLD